MFINEIHLLSGVIKIYWTLLANYDALVSKCVSGFVCIYLYIKLSHPYTVCLASGVCVYRMKPGYSALVYTLCFIMVIPKHMDVCGCVKMLNVHILQNRYVAKAEFSKADTILLL